MMMKKEHNEMVQKQEIIVKKPMIVIAKFTAKPYFMCDLLPKLKPLISSISFHCKQIALLERNCI